jgi:hypothetical protein
LKHSAEEVFADEKANAVITQYAPAHVPQGCMQLGVTQLKPKEYGPIYHKTKPNSSTPTILLVVLFPGPSPSSPTHPATMVLATHTIFFPCCGHAGRRDHTGGQSLANRYSEELNPEVIADLEAHL